MDILFFVNFIAEFFVELFYSLAPLPPPLLLQPPPQPPPPPPPTTTTPPLTPPPDSGGEMGEKVTEQ